MYFIGDIHGRFDDLLKSIKDKKIKNESLIICGDFGVGFNDTMEDVLFESMVLKNLNDNLVEDNNKLYVVRGNHDDPKYFSKRTIILSNMIFVEDYTILKIDGHNILCLGGAISIDREVKRKIPNHYWKDEHFVFDRKRLEAIRGVDIVVTHTAPDFAPLTKIHKNFVGYVERDTILKIDLEDERKILTESYNILSKNNKIDKWIYGHFHTSATTKYDNTEFILLNINEFLKLF